MKAAEFGYRKPATVAEALRMLDAEGPGAKLIAGGQSLGPMLNLRVVQPTTLIDISALDALRRAGVEGDELVLGACVTHADIEDGRAGAPTLARIARGIAYRAVRNRGTIGGSLCHADPAADWVATLPALGAIVVIAGIGGERRMRIEEFVVGALTTALAPPEMLVAVRVPTQALARAFGYAKSCRKAGEFSKASAALAVDPRGREGRVCLGALDGAPRVASAARLLEPGAPPRVNVAATHAALAAAGVADPARRHIHATILARAVMDLAA